MKSTAGSVLRKGVIRMAESKTPEQKVRGRLVRAGPAAVKLLIEMMNNEELPCKERVDIAREIQNRGFGKTPPTAEEAPSIRVVLAEEVKPFAE